MKTLAAVALFAMTGTTWAAPAKTDWSDTHEGVHARLIVTSVKDAKGKKQVAVAVEIENVSDVGGGLPLPWHDDPGEMLKFTLQDATGKELEASGIGGSYASAGPYVINLPVRSTLHLNISDGALETPTMFRPVTFQAWDIPAKHGKLFLKATLKPAAQPSKTKLSDYAWKTALELPPVAVPL